MGVVWVSFLILFGLAYLETFELNLRIRMLFIIMSKKT